MATDDERREVARMLRELPGDSTYPDLIGVIADHDGWYPAADAADRLADLIEPSCDRDALLALAEELDGLGITGFSSGWSSGAVNVGSFARRIREACGHRIVGKGEPTWL